MGAGRRQARREGCGVWYAGGAGCWGRGRGTRRHPASHSPGPVPKPESDTEHMPTATVSVSQSTLPGSKAYKGWGSMKGHVTCNKKKHVEKPT